MHDAKNIRLAKKAIRMAFETQIRGLGFSMVEILSICPTNWGLDPNQALTWMAEKMVPYYPLGDYKITEAVKQIRV
jgi:2-oxoglutarate ferredoxin oxidoreductase subunit beta